MNAYDAGRKVEARSLEILLPWIKRRSYQGRYVVTSKGPLARDLQKTYGDVFYNSDPETIYSVEIKAEEEDKHGNFFFERWSNRSRKTDGWGIISLCNVLLYHFLRQDIVYPMHWRRVQKWGIEDKHFEEYPLLEQKKYKQMNDTWGYCVPFDAVPKKFFLSAPFNPQRENAGFMEKFAQEEQQKKAEFMEKIARAS